MGVVLTSTETIESTVSVDGATVTFFDSQEARGTRNPIVLVHGTGGSTAVHFGFLFPMLASAQRVVSVDFGQPELTEGLTIDHLRRQVEAVIDHVVPGQKVTLVGYSLGAVVAATVAAARPEVIENLVLVAGWMKTDSQQLLRNNVWNSLRASGDIEALRQFTVFCAFGGPFLGARTLEDLAPAINAVGTSEFGDAQMQLNREIDIRGRVAEITATTLVIAGEHDQMVPKRHSRDLFGAIDDARYTEIASGHALVFERPAELHKHIDNFAKNPMLYAAGAIIPAVRP
jgi:pimeloyl-ACP methyl ester carboxylesterase